MPYSPSSADSIADSIEFGESKPIYNSLAEIRQAQASPRFKSDPVYRAKVESKIDRTAGTYNLSNGGPALNGEGPNHGGHASITISRGREGDTPGQQYPGLRGTEVTTRLDEHRAQREQAKNEERAQKLQAEIDEKTKALKSFKTSHGIPLISTKEGSND